jgi:hypothetical protein
MKEFKTRDFGEAVIAHASGKQLINLEKGNGKFLTFVFSDPDYEVEDLIENHFARILKLPTKDVLNSVRELKNRIYSEGRR